jgi:hypothetical protein
MHTQGNQVGNERVFDNTAYGNCACATAATPTMYSSLPLRTGVSTDGNRCWRVSNADYVGYRPAIQELRMFSDTSCSVQVSIPASGITANTNGDGSGTAASLVAGYLTDGDSATSYRPQCPACNVGAAWLAVDFSVPVNIMCVETDAGLGIGLGIGQLACEANDGANDGYTDPYRGWYDFRGCGVCNDYCRWVGNNGSGGNPNSKITHGSSFWACQYPGANYAKPDSLTAWQAVPAKCSGQGAVIGTGLSECVTNSFFVLLLPLYYGCTTSTTAVILLVYYSVVHLVGCLANTRWQ